MQKQFSLREIKQMIKLFSIDLKNEDSKIVQDHYLDIIFSLRRLKAYVYNAQAYSIKEQIQKGWL
jgi:hypothetical protein